MLYNVKCDTLVRGGAILLSTFKNGTLPCSHAVVNIQHRPILHRLNLVWLFALLGKKMWWTKIILQEFLKEHLHQRYSDFELPVDSVDHRQPFSLEMNKIFKLQYLLLLVVMGSSNHCINTKAKYLNPAGYGSICSQISVRGWCPLSVKCYWAEKISIKCYRPKKLSVIVNLSVKF